MPYRVRKAKSGYNIEKKTGGKWRKVGHSTSRAKAESSIRARSGAAHGWKPSKRKRGK